MKKKLILDGKEVEEYEKLMKGFEEYEEQIKKETKETISIWYKLSGFFIGFAVGGLIGLGITYFIGY